MGEKFKLEGAGKGPKDRTTDRQAWDEAPYWKNLEERKRKEKEENEKGSDQG